jgi:hypothetical protein
MLRVLRVQQALLELMALRAQLAQMEPQALLDPQASVLRDQSARRALRAWLAQLEAQARPE